MTQSLPALRDQIFAPQTPVTVSVVVVTFNHARYLKNCLGGILCQRAPFRIEIIIHDDASTDRTTEMVRC
ncbi:glycosyltransferase [Ruegeria arenilitoris]|nr:glycosyltransferase [Ruegeria arenilitoris]MBY6081851.1 glycosyltransferase [Ruegeria arenilitoris]